MKRFLLIILAVFFAVSCSACNQTTSSEGKADLEDSFPEESPDELSDDSDATLGQILLRVFKTHITENSDAAPIELAESIIAEDILPFEGISVDVVPGYLNGFREEIVGFSSGACLAPMIGAIPFIGYIFRLPDDADSSAFMQNLKNQADLRWNVCTEADEMVFDAVDQTVFFVMCTSHVDE